MKSKLTLLLASLISSCAFAMSQPSNASKETNEAISENSYSYVITNKEFKKKFPQELEKWIDYIKEKNPKYSCPSINSTINCVFYSSVKVEESNGDAVVIISGTTFLDASIELPNFIKNNGDNVWYKKISSYDKLAQTITKDNKTLVSIKKGDFSVKMIFSMKEFKGVDAINFPVMPLIVSNNIKDFNLINENNTLRHVLEENKKEIRVVDQSKKENLDVQVYRKLKTDIPNLLETKINISYAGKDRKHFLGKVIPNGFVFNTATSSISIEQKDDGFWINLTPGEHQLHFNAFSVSDVKEINTKDLIKDSKYEIWSLEQVNNVRQVHLEAENPVDPAQAKTPDEWRAFPAYMSSKEIIIKEDKRGVEKNDIINIKSNRTSFFGFRGNDFVHMDRMEVDNKGSLMLNKLNASDKLENFLINEKNQSLIDSEGKIGVIIPKDSFRATSQIISNEASFKSQFFDGYNTISSWDLYLAPRFKVFAVIGDDINSYGTWLNNWNLYKIFSVFLLVLTFYKLFGRTTSILAFIGILMFQGEIFSWAFWLSILLILGLLKVLPKETKFSNTIFIIGVAFLSIFSFYVFEFIKTEIQLIINPSLEIVLANKNFMGDSLRTILNLVSVGIMGYVLYKILNGKSKIIWKIFSSCLALIGVFMVFKVTDLLLINSYNQSDHVHGGEASFQRTKNNIGAKINEDKPVMALDGANLENSEAMSMVSSSVPTSPQMAMENPVKEKYNKQEITKEILNQKIQVGSGDIDSRYYNNVVSVIKDKKVSKNSNVSILIAPSWLVNIFSIVQILFLLFVTALFTLGLINLSDRKDWYDKIPKKIREHKLVKFLIINDLSKGASK